MRVLVACEYSGVIRRAMRAAGHDCWSNDLLESDDDSIYHIVGDCFGVIAQGWDLIIMHPPCTALAVSGNAWYGSGMVKNHLRIASIDWTIKLWEHAQEHAPKVCLENPVGVLPATGRIPKPQYVQPYEYGHPESKKTGLFLHNLPNLIPTNVLDLPERGYWDNQTPSGQNKLGPSKDRWKIRSATYEGIGDAMVNQWAK